MEISRDILNTRWYPQGRPFTEFEARLDFLFQHKYVEWVSFYKRWSWSQADAIGLIKKMKDENFTETYNSESSGKRRAQAQEVIDIFNQVFDRNIGLNVNRITMICARIKEGRNMTPPVGPAQFRAVFEFKKKEWTGTEFEKHLNIKTLCAPSHFLDYLEAARLDYIKRKQQVKSKEEGVKMEGALFK